MRTQNSLKSGKAALSKLKDVVAQSIWIHDFLVGIVQIMSSAHCCIEGESDTGNKGTKLSNETWMVHLHSLGMHMPERTIFKRLYIFL